MNGNRREPMGPDLLRQRRNLLVISLGLDAVILAGAKFKSEISIFGAGIEFEHPERLLIGAWVLWAYFLLRYLQYLSEESSLGIGDGVRTCIKRRHTKAKPHHSQYLRLEGSPWFRWQLLDGDYNPEEGDVDLTPVGPQNPIVKAWWTVCAFISVAIGTTRFTDYLLPVLVASSPVVLTGWKWATAA